jgi:hypothetical protein
MPKHPSETPEYWEELALNERFLAKTKRGLRWGSVESIRIHEQNAKDYEETARKLRAAQTQGVE